ncbi:MAG TPA: fatty acid desaturase [Chitinophagales bacterium]|nr:fatty acid desaturase [Chitinophagales bacterium]HRK26285.1 fatty acid desaturase [Chitinophagales bacterium]
MHSYTLPKNSRKGVIIGLTIIALWFAATAWALTGSSSLWQVSTWVKMLLITHLYTGIFITAHDAMHGTVSWNRRVNIAIGKLCTTLFMFNSFSLLSPKHYDHHKYAGTENDPDFHPPHFWSWYFHFLMEYLSIRQFILTAIAFNLLQLVFPVQNLVLFWIIPSVLSTFQLFIFGTYLPHRGTHHNPHNARSQNTNHLLAFVTCYFFGYHYEHHDSPSTPWWLLYKTKT